MGQVSGIPADRIAAAEAVATMAERFAALAASAPADVRVAATPSWSVTDVLGHVAMEPSRYAELVHGRGDWPPRVADLPAFNAEQVRTLPTRDPAELAAKLCSDTSSLLETVASFGNEAPWMYFDGDQRIRSDRALGTLLGEFVVHGHDIARTLGRRWPIDADHVPIIMDGLNQVLPGWVDPAASAGHTATYELRLRGLARYVYAFEDGALTVDPPRPGRTDVHISAEPATALLLNYGRIGPWLPGLLGKALVWGRRPWLGPRLTRRFRSA